MPKIKAIREEQQLLKAWAKTIRLNIANIRKVNKHIDRAISKLPNTPTKQ